MSRVPAGADRWRPAILLSSWFGSGFLPYGPGTWGSLLAMPLAYPIAVAFGPMGLLLGAALLFPVGTVASQEAREAGTASDPGWIVIDEVVGQLLVLAAVPLDARGWALAFLLFRVADIAKPWPVGLADRRVKGGFGIMLDDVLAAVMAIAVLLALRWLGAPL